MATQVQTIKDRLQFVHDELKHAADKQGEAAKEHLRVAMANAESTRMELETRLKDQHANDQMRFKGIVADLQETSHQAKAAIAATGAQFKEHVEKSIAAAKRAIEK